MAGALSRSRSPHVPPAFAARPAARVASATEGAAPRTFAAQTLGGTGFEVTVPSDCRAERLVEELAQADKPGMLFHLVAEDGSILDDMSAPLPAGRRLTVVVENPSPLCGAAQEVLRKAGRPEARGDAETLARFRLGRCGRIGDFPSAEWKEDPRMEDCMSYHDYELGRYEVLELTLIDGEGKHRRLVGVINSGDADCNTGFWGSVYLRPGFEEVGGILSYGDTESKWEIQDSSWYTAPSTPLEPCKGDLVGGPEAETPLETHLAHALAMAYYGGEDDD